LIGSILHSRQPTQLGSSFYSLSHLRWEFQTPLRLHQAGCNAIASNAVLSQDNSQAFGKVNLCGLRDGVWQARTAGFDAGQAGRAHERALRLREVRPGSFHEPEVRLDVVQKAPVPVVLDGAFVEVEEVGHPRPACVADHDVDAAHLLVRLADKVLHGRFHSDVGADGMETRRLWVGMSRRDCRKLGDELRGTVDIVRVVYHLGYVRMYSTNYVLALHTTLQSGANTRAI